MLFNLTNFRIFQAILMVKSGEWAARELIPGCTTLLEFTEAL
jgi:hypothetical protein